LGRVRRNTLICCLKIKRNSWPQQVDHHSKAQSAQIQYRAATLPESRSTASRMAFATGTTPHSFADVYWLAPIVCFGAGLDHDRQGSHRFNLMKHHFRSAFTAICSISIDSMLVKGIYAAERCSDHEYATNDLL
jgi:hypothetical protein